MVQVESWGGDFVDFQVVLVPSQVVNANPSDSQVYPHCQCWIENISNLLSLQYKENKGKFAASNGRVKAKSFSASGGLCPLTPWPGALPLDPAGGSAPRPPL